MESDEPDGCTVDELNDGGSSSSSSSSGEFGRTRSVISGLSNSSRASSSENLFLEGDDKSFGDDDKSEEEIGRPPSLGFLGSLGSIDLNSLGSRRDLNFHKHEACDSCRANPIEGFLFLSKTSEEHYVSLCGNCEADWSSEKIRIAPPKIKHQWTKASRNGDLDAIREWINDDPKLLR